MFRVIIAFFVSLCLVGCTSMKAVDVPSSGAAPQFSVGDTIRISTKEGASYKLKVTELSGNTVSGTDESGKRIKVAFDQIAAVQIEKRNVAKTAGAGIGAGLLIAAVLFVVGIIAFGKAIKSSGD